MSSGRADPTTATVPGVGAAISPLRPGTPRLFASCLLLVVAVVAWRAGAFFTGGADPVVLAKALLTGLAFLLALPGTDDHGQPGVPLAPLAWLAGYLAIAVMGALSGDLTVASLILCVRLALTAAVLVLLVRHFGPESVLSSLGAAMLAVMAVAVVTGLPTISSGRLSGGVPAATPNEIAMLCAIPLILLLANWVRGVARPAETALIPLLAAVMWLTGSRTGLAVLAAACLALYVVTRRISVGGFALAVLCVPVLAYAIWGTSLLSEFLGRGGTRSLTTLSSRTIAWNAALDHPDDFWSHAFGGGLALKQIPVPATYWSQQGLDSSLFSGLVQVGWVGVALLVAWVTWAVWTSSLHAVRVYLVPVLLFLVGRSLLESGLFDTTPAFLGFFCCCLVAAWPRARPSHDQTREEERFRV